MSSKTTNQIIRLRRITEVIQSYGPTNNSRETYIRTLEAVLNDICNSGTHIGARNLENIAEAVALAYKAGLHEPKESTQ